jgi:hypothetical protein
MRQGGGGHDHGDQKEIPFDEMRDGVDFHARGVAQIRILVNVGPKKRAETHS